MNSALYFKRVKQIMNERGISQEEALSYLGRKGANARKRDREAEQQKEKSNTKYWWQDKD
jgi:hypothetical protein